MCCCKCFSDRKTPLCIVMLMAFLAMGCGGLMIYFSIEMVNLAFLDKLEETSELEGIQLARELLYYLLISVSGITIAVAFLAWCFYCCTNKCFALTYSCIVLPVWIILVLAGLGSLIAVAVGDNVIDNACDDFNAGVTINSTIFN